MRSRRRRPLPPELARELVLLERRLTDALHGELDRQLLAQRRDVDGELTQVNERIDGVLARALRALNQRSGGTQA